MAKKKGIKSKSEQKAPDFIKEVFGLATVLFSLLAFLCLVTGDGLFYTAGLAVRNFLYGLFGIYVYFVLAYLTLFGVSLVAGKKFFAGKELVVYPLNIAVLLVFLIVHLAVSYKGGMPIGEELSSAFYAPETAMTPGGAAASLLIFPVAALLSKIGAYVIYVLLTLFVVAYLFRDAIISLFNGNGKRKPEHHAKRAEEEGDGSSEAETVEKKAEEQLPHVENFFFNEKSGFAFRDKRDMATGRSRPLQPWGGRFEFKNIADVARREIYAENRATAASPSDRQPGRPFAPDRSAKVDLDKMNVSPMRMTNVSETIDKKQSSSGYERSSVGKDVYTIPVTDRKTETRSFDDSSERRTDYRSSETDARGSSSVRGERATTEESSVPRFVNTAFERGNSSDVIRRDRQDTDYGNFARVREEAETPSREYSERRVEVREVAPHSTVVDRAEADIDNVYVPKTPLSRSNVRTALSDANISESEKSGQIEKPAERAPRYRLSEQSGDNVSAPSENERESAEYRRETEYPSTGESAEAPSSRPPQFANAYAGTGAASYSNPERAIEKPVQQAMDTDDFFDDYDSEEGYSFIPGMPLNYTYDPPKKSLLVDYTPDADALWKERQRQEFCKEKIVSVFANKGIEVKVVNVVSGSSVTRFDIEVPDDVSLKEINSLQPDLEFRLKATGEFRMYCIPDSELIGIEVASKARRTVGMLNVFERPASSKVQYKNGLYFMLGEDVLGTPIYLDLMSMPHLLICGATGTGKSVCLNTLLVSLMYNYSPEDLRLVLVDPKRVEFKAFEHIPHLVFDEILGLDDDGKATKAAAVLDWAVQETERRYKFLADKGYKNVNRYNKSIDPSVDAKIPYIVIIIDEFADFVMSSPEFRKNIEVSIGRLAQKARAAGVSVILATQRPSVDVISGSIKTNIPSRICFKTATPTDSRVVIDDNGAEKLLSKGDCLFKTTENSTLTRGQGAFLSDDELEKVVNYVKAHNKCYFDDSIVAKIKKRAAAAKQLAEEEDLPDPKGGPGGGAGRISLDPADADEVSKRALRLAIDRTCISTSTLRSFLRIGYNRANSIIIWMERMSYITKPLENQTRKTLMTKEQYVQVYGEFVEDW